MKQIPLTQGKVAIVDDSDYEALVKFKWCINKKHRSYYACRYECTPERTIMITMHRALLGALTGQHVDHRNGDGLDNQRENIRIATRSQNGANRTKMASNSSGRCGVSWHRATGKWSANIAKDGVLKYLGLFVDRDEAARVYDNAARVLHGDFARLNFPANEMEAAWNA